MAGPSPGQAPPSKSGGGWTVRTMGSPWVSANSQSPLILPGYGHDGAGTVTGEHIVGHPDGNLLARRRIDGEPAGEDPGFFLLQIGALPFALPERRRPIGFHLRPPVCPGDGVHQRVFGREHQVGGAERGVRARGEHADRPLAPDEREYHLGTLAAADPVALHLLRALRPIQVIQPAEQRFGVFRDAQHPLAERTADAGEVAHLRIAVDDFLVGQGGAQLRAPPDGLFLLISQPAVEELLEDPLGPLVITGVGGIDLPAPVVGKTERLELAAKAGHVAFRGRARVGARPQGILFGRQAEGVPADGMQHVEAAHALVTGDDVRGGVAFGMPHVQPVAAGVGEHVQDVVLRPGPVDVLGHAKGLAALPVILPLGFDFSERVRGHGSLRRRLLVGLHRFRLRRRRHTGKCLG